MDRIKTGTGKRLRSEPLAPTALPVPYDATAMPGAILLGEDGSLYVSNTFGGTYIWTRLLTGTRNITLIRNVNSQSGPGFSMAKARSNTLNSRTVVQVDDRLGTVVFSGADGADYISSSLIRAAVDATPGPSSVPGRLDFYISPPGGLGSSDPDPDFALGSLALALRLNSAGNLLLGNTTGTERLSVTGNVQVTDPANGFKVGSDKVVGARVTGWTAPTGTASRATFATYAGQTISDPPTQAEVQAIDDHLKALSERLKALIDDATTHGLIGPTP